MADLDNRIEFLASSCLDMISSIDHLKKHHAKLMKELSQINQDINAEEQKLADLLGIVITMQERRDSIAQLAQALREQEQPIPGSADVDRRR
jgi:predicted house-cleaning noncanonical NTP pyrophosphatase (MazG superfamily)